MLSHELRNPLSAVRTAVGVLNSPNVDEIRDNESRQAIKRQTSQMARLLDDLLDVSRITQDKIALDRSVIDLRDTVRNAVDSVQALADVCEIEIGLCISDQVISVFGDATRLEQIHSNLLTNAIKYSPPGEKVVVEIKHDNQTALIRVRDNGAGIAPDMLESIFDVFIQSDETLDRSHGGMGVGLTLVRKLVEMHGGKVTAYSQGRGQGSIFEVRLPLAAADEESPPKPVLRPHITNRVDRVVIIEDQEDNRAMLKSYLELEGVIVEAVGNGAEGVELVNQVRPNTVIIDIGLPEMDGYEVARQIRKSLGSQITLIALTGYGQPQDIEKAHQAGFDHHLVKPLQTDALTRLLGLGSTSATKT